MPSNPSRLLVILSALLALPACVEDSEIEDGETESFGGKADSIAEGSAKARAILSLVNDPAVGIPELDDGAGLSSRVAKGIIGHRDGADGIAGTADDDAFDTLAEVDTIPYVGPAALDALLTYAKRRGLLAQEAVITAEWSFKTLTGNQLTACPAGFGTVALYSQALDSQLAPVGAPIVDLFDCAEGSRASAPLPPAVYKVWIEVTDGATGIYAQSTASVLDVVARDKTYTATILDDGGYISLAWKLQGATSNQPVACSQVAGADAIVTNLVSPTGAVVQKFDCAAGRGLTAGVLASTYSVSVHAFSSAGVALGTAPAINGTVVRAPNQVTDLGEIIIPIDGL